MQSSYLVVLTLFHCASGLKLLTETEDSTEWNDEVLDQIDEEWAADSSIKLSYKPIKDKQCPAGSGGANKITLPASGSCTVPICKFTKQTTFKGVYDAYVLGLKTKTKGYKISKLPYVCAKLASLNLQQTAGAKAAVAMAVKFDYGGDSTCELYSVCASTEAGVGKYLYEAAGVMWAKNDPKVQNIRGETFEIMATGTFSLLSLTESSKKMLEASATIDRAGTRCGATYIQNVTLSGQWVEDVGVPNIEIKAEAAVPKIQALQVNFAEGWQSAVSASAHTAVENANAKQIVLKLNKLKVLVSVDSHRIHEGGKKTSRFANFLNVNFEGVSKLPGVSVGGLLGTDSHEDAIQLPDECQTTKLTSVEESNMLSAATIA